ncbi:MAG: hypothetical protein BHW30_00810 [Firmicutes bacterium CAG_194_44_15]|nr:MAG: hypothetical protein BHW30_00810 [Firmicutes bacterium CAG_194_44_15]
MPLLLCKKNSTYNAKEPNANTSASGTFFPAVRSTASVCASVTISCMTKSVVRNHSPLSVWNKSSFPSVRKLCREIAASHACVHT